MTTKADGPEEQTPESEPMVPIPTAQVLQAERYLFGGADLIDLLSVGSETQKEMRTAAAKLAVSRMIYQLDQSGGDAAGQG